MTCALMRLAASSTLLTIAAAALGQEPAGQGLGLCPPGAANLDGYMQALCDGEAALQAGDYRTATERFAFAAALPRTQASNELAWAGLAAAHCHSREIDAGSQWAAHFSQARRLWLGDLDCGAAGDDPRAQLSPFVRSRMCTDRLASDYAIVRGSPQAGYAIDLRARLTRIGDALAAACAAGPTQQKQATQADAASADSGKKKVSKTSTGRKQSGKARGRKAAKPNSG